MSISLSSLTLFFLSLFIGITMTIEGFLIISLQKQITPLPTKILYWVSVGVAGKEKSTRWFAGKNTPENLRTYAILASLFGASLFISSFLNLNWLLTHLK